MTKHMIFRVNLDICIDFYDANVFVYNDASFQGFTFT